MRLPARPVASPLASIGWKVAGGVATLLAAFLVGGFLLPGTWAAEATRTVGAPPQRVLELLATPRRWDEWTPADGVTFREQGPAAGVGARRTWNDPKVGSGVFVITDVQPRRLLRYRVDVSGGLVTQGTFSLASASDGGTTITWREEGDFGRNPLLGWAALGMQRSQGKALEGGLERLARVLESGA